MSQGGRNDLVERMDKENKANTPNVVKDVLIIFIVVAPAIWLLVAPENPAHAISM